MHPVGVRISGGALFLFFRPCSPMAEARGVNPRQSEFESRRGHRAALSNMTTHNFLRRHPGRAPPDQVRGRLQAREPGSMYPCHAHFMMPGYLGPGSRRLRGSPGMMAEVLAKSVRLQQHVPVAQRQRRRLQIPFSGSSTLPGTPRHRQDHHTRLAQRQSIPLTSGRSGFRNPQRVPVPSLAQLAERRPDMAEADFARSRCRSAHNRRIKPLISRMWNLLWVASAQRKSIFALGSVCPSRAV